jgi:pimeloyl-ACP methyl ester carboxylesterase
MRTSVTDHTASLSSGEAPSGLEWSARGEGGRGAISGLHAAEALDYGVAMRAPPIVAAIVIVSAIVAAQDSAPVRRPLDGAAREQLAALAEKFWKARPKTAFESWDPGARAALDEAAAKVPYAEGQLAEAVAVLWRPAAKLGPRAEGTSKRTIKTPDGEAWFYAKGSGRRKGLVIGLHGGGAGAGSASEGIGTWVAKDCIGFYPQAIKLVDDSWNTVYGERFILTMIEIAKAEYQIDPDRVYVMGFSMGGTGSWFTAGRHPDLLAGAAPCAGVFMAQPKSQLARKDDVVAIQHGLLPNVRNLAMWYYIGLADKNCMPGTYLYVADRLDELRKEDPDGYREVHFKTYPGLAHAHPPGEPKAGIAFLEKRKRNTFPEKIVWEHAAAPYPLPGEKDKSTRIQKQHFYWIRCEAPRDRQVIRATRSGNTITVAAEGTADGLKGIGILLNPSMIDPNADVIVRHGDKTVYAGRPAPDLRVVLETLDARIDTAMVFDRRIDL